MSDDTDLVLGLCSLCKRRFVTDQNSFTCICGLKTNTVNGVVVSHEHDGIIYTPEEWARVLKLKAFL